MGHKDTIDKTKKPLTDESKIVLRKNTEQVFAKVLTLLSCLMVTADGAHMISPDVFASSLYMPIYFIHADIKIFS